MRWDSWDALASSRQVRMEDTGQTDDEGRPVLEKVLVDPVDLSLRMSVDVNEVFWG